MCLPTAEPGLTHLRLAVWPSPDGAALDEVETIRGPHGKRLWGVGSERSASVVDPSARSVVMGGQMDQAKGRAKEAIGDLTGDEDLKAEGKADRAAGEVKEKVGDAVDKVKDVVEDVKDKVTDTVHKATD